MGSRDSPVRNLNFAAVPRNFSRSVYFNKSSHLAVVVPHQRKDGLYYEVNIKGYPRFFMSWSELGRFDLAANEDPKAVPYQLILAVSDMLEEEHRRKQ